MEYKILQLAKYGPILTVTINRPESLNALNTAFFDEMDHFIAFDAADPELRCIILTGTGKAFVAGADIAEMVNMDSAQATAFSRRGQNTFMNLSHLAVPVIAAINGFALGGGLELAMACDIRIASDNARFGQPEVNLGLIPGYAGTQRLPRLTGLGNALLLLLTGEPIMAAEALRIGLVQKLTEPDKLMDEAMRIAKVIASRGPMAVKLAKHVTWQGMETTIAKGSLLEAENFGQPFGSEGTEGMRAFLEKRAPQW